MKENKEIQALLHLIEDPDEEVFHTVAERIEHYGTPIIPNLENLWENTPDSFTQSRIELLIHRLHFRALHQDFTQWFATQDPDLLSGAILVCRFLYPELNVQQVLSEVEKLRRNVWLELNNYLTSLEQANVVGTILYNYYNLRGNETSYQQPSDFVISKVIESKKGNPIGLGVLYLIICELLNVSIRAVHIPKQFILAFFESGVDFEELKNEPVERIQFYIDPMNGHIYTQQDIDVYFKRISVPPTISFFKPFSNKRVIQHVLEELAKCYEEEANLYKKQALLDLAALADT
jgi:regulator of sirC expression with transglutaminase-like and TPR domain